MKRNILRHLLQSKTGRYLTPLFDDTLFDEVLEKALFNCIKDYYNTYDVNPSKANLLYFIEKGNSALTEAAKDLIRDELDTLFVRVEDSQIVEEHLIEYAQKRMIKELFIKNVGGIEEADDYFYDKIRKKVDYITNLKTQINGNENVLSFPNDPFNPQSRQGHPTFLRTLNDMTNAGGFLAPELIVLLAGPKCFKTGVLLAIAYNYALSGLNVFYADFENGKEAILGRLYQTMLTCAKNDLNENRFIKDQIKDKMQRFGCGSIEIGEYRQRADDPSAVEATLDKLKLEKGWVPDMIIWDYIDLAAPKDRSIKERRLQIQANYSHVSNINKERNVFSMTVSKVKADKFNKEFAGAADFGEDSEKAYNCHAAFYLSRTEDDIREGFARIFPIVQREGISYRNDIFTMLKIDESIHLVEELDELPYAEDVTMM